MEQGLSTIIMLAVLFLIGYGCYRVVKRLIRYHAECAERYRMEHEHDNRH